MKLPTVAVLAALAGIAHADPTPAPGPTQAPAPEPTIDRAERARVVDAVLAALDRQYIFPDVAARVRKAMAHRSYDQTSGPAFAEALTKELQALSHDKHMHVQYSPQPIPDHPLTEPTPAEVARMHEVVRFWNGGIVKAERMDGNVGYLRVDIFPGPDDAAEHVAAAMSLLADTSALIIDLRENHGGDPETVALYVSYLYDAGVRLHINDIYTGTTKTTREYWTSPALAGRRYANKPVYVLTSSQTFSGGEELTYDLKVEKRATIVGETTGGGANPIDPVRLDAHFAMNVPTGRAVNPTTKTNWEGVGVKPDVAVPAAKALDVAYLAALQQVRAALPKDRPGMLAEIDHAIEELKARS